MAGVEYESILCVKPIVHVFKIPPRSSNRGYRAADWKLDAPDWTGRLRVVAKGRDLSIKLEDKNSGELFARCPVDQHPGIALESVSDSSRYFVLRIMDDNGRNAFIGIGFEDRGDSFDLNVALQDHFKHIKHEKEAEKAGEELQKGPKLDLGFKEGQTIRINIATNKNGDDGTPKKSRPKGTGTGMGFLPPPPGGIKLPPPGGASNSSSLGSSDMSQNLFQSECVSNPITGSNISNTSTAYQPTQNSSDGSANVDLLFDLGIPSVSSNQGQSGSNPTTTTQSQSSFGSDFDLLSGLSAGGPPAQPAGGSSDPWGEFASASSDTDQSWVKF